MKKVTILLLAIVGFAFVFSSCGKYDDGPGISFRSKKARAVGVWVYEKVTVDGTDQDISFWSDVKYEVMKDGKYQARVGNVISSEGTWEFGSKKETFETLETGSSTKDVATILRLTNKEFWTTQTDNGVTMEVHMKAD
jgi:hypothetical protein